MAITRTLTAVAETEEERTWRATIETPRTGSADYSITVHREIVQRDAEGNVVSVTPGRTIKRMAADVMGETLPLPGGKSLPMPAAFFMLPAKFDLWAAEEEAREAAAKAAAETAAIAAASEAKSPAT